MKHMRQLKIRIKILLRILSDVRKGYAFKFAGKHVLSELAFPYALELSQEIKPSETIVEKLFNIQTTSKKINTYVLPGQIFSFWKIVGDPKNNLKKSRSIINGKITNEIGGGVCQVSGIIYHISILAGMEIIERYNHSIDIYTEETRFAPLGTDSTVVYGYKDLRIKNVFPFPIQFTIDTTSDRISIKLLSTEPIKEKQLTYNILQDASKKTVHVTDEKGILINTSVYKY